MNTVSNCIVCHKPLSGKQRLFCSVECKNDYYLSYKALKKRALERKTELIACLGGQCNRCGHDNITTLSFYDKAGKTLHIDINILANSNLEKLKKKLENAQVLCRNCAEEVQNSTPPSSQRLVLRSSCEEERLGYRKDGLDSWLATRNDEKKVNLLNKFTENLPHCGVKIGQTIVLGVSGGIDSVVMLDLFAKTDLKLNIIVAHVNHGFREDADEDEKFVKSLAKSHGFQSFSAKLKPHQRTSSNLEEYFRDERRKFLLQVVHENQADFLAMAHNADDQAETFILNAVRGSGPAGLGGMSMSEDQLIRPLLNFSRLEIENYARENRLQWHEDVTNEDVSYSRNYVRHRILPLLLRLNPEYLSAIHRTTRLQRQIDGHLKEEAYRIITNYQLPITKKDDGAGISTEHLRRLDKPLLYEVLGLLYEKTKGDRQNLTLAHLSAIESLVNVSSGTKTLDLPGNVVARRTYDKLDFYSKLRDNTASIPSTKKLHLGTQKFANWEIVVSALTVSDGRADGNDEIFIDAEMLKNLTVRTRQPGDRIASIGLTGTKKLQDLFVDAKIDRVKRATWPVLVDTKENQILWIPGLAKAKVDLRSKELLKIKIVEVDYETLKEK